MISDEHTIAAIESCALCYSREHNSYWKKHFHNLCSGLASRSYLPCWWFYHHKWFILQSQTLDRRFAPGSSHLHHAVPVRPSSNNDYSTARVKFPSNHSVSSNRRSMNSNSLEIGSWSLWVLVNQEVVVS